MRSITIEECLELMAGLSAKAIDPAFIVLDRDKKIIFDIAKKVYKGSALTDRQLEAVKKILITRYKSQFKMRGIDLENSVNTLRQPLRHLDRSEYIRLEDGSADDAWASRDALYESAEPSPATLSNIPNAYFAFAENPEQPSQRKAASCSTPSARVCRTRRQALPRTS